MQMVPGRVALGKGDGGPGSGALGEAKPLVEFYEEVRLGWPGPAARGEGRGSGCFHWTCQTVPCPAGPGLTCGDLVL